MTLGGYSKQNNRYFSARMNVFPTTWQLRSAFNGNFPSPTAPQNLAQVTINTHNKRNRCMPLRAFSLADPLHLIPALVIPIRRADTLTLQHGENHTTPYAGLIYDINDNWSAYASYGSIFQPQNKRDAGQYLAPIAGNNYEAGLKSDWMNSRLTTTLSVFRIEQNNVAQATTHSIPAVMGSLGSLLDGTVSKRRRI